ncbi:MAG: CDP-diacylglycerol--glycerol-3-phosphate 3-phosphatidyltransferase [Clostridia bacterium]
MCVKMNLPNKLTVLRVILIVPFVGLMMIETPMCQLGAALVFGLASVTDWLDGWYARKHHLVTDFGKLMDPMADKLLVMAALIGLVAQGRAPWLCAMVLLGREFVISGFRLVAASKGVVIAADTLGKYKTASQMVGLGLMLGGGWWAALTVPGEILLWLSVVLSVVSCAQYIFKNREVVGE